MALDDLYNGVIQEQSGQNIVESGKLQETIENAQGQDVSNNELPNPPLPPSEGVVNPENVPNGVFPGFNKESEDVESKDAEVVEVPEIPQKEDASTADIYKVSNEYDEEKLSESEERDLLDAEFRETVRTVNAEAVIPAIKDDEIGVPNDDFLTTILDLYTPDIVTDKDIKTDVLPNKKSLLYDVAVDNNSFYKDKIKDAYDLDDGTRASYSLEELELHNRLTEVLGVDRDFEHFLLIQAPKGDLVVAKNLDTGSNIGDVFMEEAKDCVKCGKRIEIQLLESYSFEDSHGRFLNRERFRATMSEIKTFIINTGMRGRITKDAVLVIFE